MCFDGSSLDSGTDSVTRTKLEDSTVPGVYYYQLDVSDFAAIESTAETIRRQHGDPTVLVNNAGVGEHKIPLEFTILELTFPFPV